MCGDPPNIIIGSKLGYSFFDFLSNTGLVAFISLIVVVIYFCIAFHKDLKTGDADVDISNMPDPKSAIVDKKGFIISSIIFAIAVVLLVSHSATHLTVAFIGVFIAIITLLTSLRHVKEILKGVDYKTLLFFVGLFIVVGGLEQTDILVMIANFIEKISGGNWFIMVAIIVWVSGIASAFVDNIPFAATMVPVISSLAATTGIPLPTLAWSLAVGTDIGGSATPIGASANVVGTSVAAKEGYPVSWGKYCVKLAPATVIVLLISMGYIFLRYVIPQQGGM
jgi:Na+/H+ antiporter NhaD/arsenite permease-like protein